METLARSKRKMKSEVGSVDFGLVGDGMQTLGEIRVIELKDGSVVVSGWLVVVREAGVIEGGNLLAKRSEAVWAGELVLDDGVVEIF